MSGVKKQINICKVFDISIVNSFCEDKYRQELCWRCVNMNGTKPGFMKNSVVKQSYYEQSNPYANAPSCHVNLLELSRYAKKCGKKLVELTQEEVKMFSI